MYYIDSNFFPVLLFAVGVLCLIEFIDWERALRNLAWAMLLFIVLMLVMFEGGEYGVIHFVGTPWVFWGLALATAFLLSWHVHYVLPDRPLPLWLQRVLRAARFRAKAFLWRWLFIEETKHLCWKYWHQ